jgi:hypothetical protein
MACKFLKKYGTFQKTPVGCVGITMMSVQAMWSGFALL